MMRFWEGQLVVEDADAREANDAMASCCAAPLVRLKRLMPSAGFHLYAKLEAFNSIKDRPALPILRRPCARERPGRERWWLNRARATGDRPRAGLPLPRIALHLRRRFPYRGAESALRILRAYGAEIDVVTEPDPASG